MRDYSRLRESNSRPPAYKAGAITTMLKRHRMKIETATSARFELTRAEPSRFRIYRLNLSAKMPSHVYKKWRIRVSIPVPPRCKRGTLPIELIPHGWRYKAGSPSHWGSIQKKQPWQDSNLQPLDPKSSALSIAPQGLLMDGSCGIRTHAYKCRLELESSALDHSAMKPLAVRKSDA